MGICIDIGYFLSFLVQKLLHLDHVIICINNISFILCIEEYLFVEGFHHSHMLWTIHYTAFVEHYGIAIDGSSLLINSRQITCSTNHIWGETFLAEAKLCTFKVLDATHCLAEDVLLLMSHLILQLNSVRSMVSLDIGCQWLVILITTNNGLLLLLFSEQSI